jgi:transcriptional regulator with XRE-family HTH domain
MENFKLRSGGEVEPSDIPKLTKTWIPTGAELKVIRRSLGLTQADMERRTGIKASTIGKWEQERSHPRSNDLRLILAVYRIEATAEDVDGD